MNNIWQKLPRPIMILAPMEDVTDTVFRRVVASCGAPDLYFTEFTSVDGLFSKGYPYVAKRLQFTSDEHPLIAQIWGAKPENYFKAAQMLGEMGFDGIDINMGCPEKRVIKQGMCAALIENRSLAKEIIQATKEGAGKLPVSVKTRIGVNTIVTEDWTGFLLDQEIEALIVHGRTAKEMSEVPVHWDEITKVVKLRDMMKLSTVIIGNGDVLSRNDALERVKESGVDGIMIGRGVFHDPWVFNKEHFGDSVTFQEKLVTLEQHVRLYQSTWGDNRPFAVLKKFVKCYIAGYPGSSEIRADLMTTTSYEEILEKIGRLKTV